MTKRESQLLDLKSAAQRLAEALKHEKTDMNRDATIQRFEFTFELTWKALKNIVEENNIYVLGSKSVFREAAKLGIINNPEEWFRYLESRNLTSHTYDVNVAEKVYNAAQDFSKALALLIPKIENYHNQ